MDVVIPKGRKFRPEGPYKRVICEGNAYIEDSITAESIECKGSLEIKGDLSAVKVYVKRGLKARAVRVSSLQIGSFLTAGLVETNNLEVHGPIRVSSSLKAIRCLADGSITATSIDVDECMVRGSLRALRGNIGKLIVGGSIDLEKTSVREATISGSARLKDSEVGSMKVDGTLRLLGSIHFSYVETSIAEIKNEVKGGVLRVKDVLNVEGSLRVRKLVFEGVAKVRGRVLADEIQLLGKAKGELTGGKIQVVGEALSIKGEDVNITMARVRTVRGKRVKIRDSIVDNIEAEEVEISGRSSVQSVVADRVYVVEGRVEKVFYREKMIVSPKAKVVKAVKIGDLHHLFNKE